MRRTDVRRCGLSGRACSRARTRRGPSRRPRDLSTRAHRHRCQFVSSASRCRSSLSLSRGRSSSSPRSTRASDAERSGEPPYEPEVAGEAGVCGPARVAAPPFAEEKELRDRIEAVLAGEHRRARHVAAAVRAVTGGAERREAWAVGGDGVGDCRRPTRGRAFRGARGTRLGRRAGRLCAGAGGEQQRRRERRTGDPCNAPHAHLP